MTNRTLAEPPTKKNADFNGFLILINGKGG